MLRQRTKLFTHKSSSRLSQGFRYSITDFYVNGKAKMAQRIQMHIFAEQLEASRNIVKKSISKLIARSEEETAGQNVVRR